MATDTARVELELASGRNEITAPFHQTAQRRRRQHEPSAASVGAPADSPARFSARPPWIAFAAALLAFIYRMIVALKKYVHFDHPIATVLATQLIVFLSILIVLVMLTNPFRV